MGSSQQHDLVGDGATAVGVQRVVELLTDDNYLLRDTSSGERKYRFRYRLMRQWWKINRA